MADAKPKKARVPKANKGTPSTQKFLPFSEVRDDTVIMNDGSLRAIILISSTNFALKSADEQNAVIQAYQSFLNSLDFPFEISIQSRKLDVDGYLANLEKLERKQTNDLLRIQMTDYRQFIAELVQLGDIMSKHFYIIVPYNPSSDKKRGFFRQIQSVFTPVVTVKLKADQFADRKHVLDQRVQTIVGGLSSMSLNAVTLDTQSIIELLYNTYNPDIMETQPMEDVSKVQVDIS